MFVRGDSLSIQATLMRGPVARAPAERFAESYIPEPMSGCWLWMKGVDKNGYGKFNYPIASGKRVHVRAHRYSYWLCHGTIDDSLVTDHLCRVPSCVNPQHLELVTTQENTRRGLAPGMAGARNRAKTHCPQGHEYTGWNLIVMASGSRACRICNGERNRVFKANKRASRKVLKHG